MNSISSARGKAFFWSAALWLVLGLGVVSSFSASERWWYSAGWFFLFWTLVLLDLALIAGLVGAMVSWQESSDKARMGIRVAVLGLLKVLWLVIFGAILILKRGIPTPSLLVGLGTLIVVPLFGGLVWSYQASSPDRAAR